MDGLGWLGWKQIIGIKLLKIEILLETLGLEFSESEAIKDFFLFSTISRDLPGFAMKVPFLWGVLIGV